MPKNCSADVPLIIDHIDKVLTKGTAAEIHALKDMFGLASLEHNDDFAAVLPIGPYQWQGNDFYTGYSEFFQFCDAVENAVPGSERNGQHTDRAFPSACRRLFTARGPKAAIPALCRFVQTSFRRSDF